MARKLVVLVHGWSVTSTETYGELADRLDRIGRASEDLELDIQNIWLGRYVSFHDEVRVEDLSRAFQAAIAREILPKLGAGDRFVCITHSTGGPVVRDWWHRYHLDAQPAAPCPMSHLIMLAPANFGSALAQLGKGRLSRMASFFHGVQPGTGVLDWLELGSPESWTLNRSWIDRTDRVTAGDSPVFPFVLIGQSIDRKMYDHVNSYTGEVGSDGVVRSAAANLNATLIELRQEVGDPNGDGDLGVAFHATPPRSSQRTAFKIIPGRSHSGKKMGILRSIEDRDDADPTVAAIVRCLRVTDESGYQALCDDFDAESEQTITDERVEPASEFLRPDHTIIHDRHCMVILRVQDEAGHVVEDFDFKLTGVDDDPNKLPPGFLTDRQCNRRHGGTLTLYLNHDLLAGSARLPHPDKPRKTVRPAVKGVRELGFHLDPHQTDPRLFVRYVPSWVKASADQLGAVIKPNQTTMIDITIRRIVGAGTFALTQDRVGKSFEDQEPGTPVV